MTSNSLFWFQCPRCNNMFRKFVFGRYINCHDLGHSYCFYDNTIGEIHNNSFVYPYRNIECRNCLEGVRLDIYIE